VGTDCGYGRATGRDMATPPATLIAPGVWGRV
jgi:hypothetical protein